VSEAGLAEEAADGFAFHITDWLDDLEAFRLFCGEPQAMTNEALHKLLVQFLVHAPNHLAAASKLFMDIPVTDVFNVGATTESE
jgi:hypothetical protein